MSTRRASALALSISAALSGLLLLWAVWAAPEAVRAPLAWGGGGAAVLLTAAVTVATYALRQTRALRERSARVETDARRFATETVPELVARLRAGDSADTALTATTRTLGELDHSHARALLSTLATEIGRGESSRAAAMAACANAAGRMQALATSMLADLREMEHRHTDEDVLGDLLHLDHRTAQAGRLADSIAILTGARSGRRWAKPIVMESVLRGAMGRINGYQRVRLHSTSEVAVAGHAAEGVMHALAELLDNAANFSPPTAEVHVYVEEVPAGLIITVEDSGLVMSDVQLRRAERAVSADRPLDLTGLSGTRLGLAVVGCLARKHQLTVSFRPSARGGTGALMLLPQELLTQPQSAGPAGRHDTGSLRRPAAPAELPARRREAEPAAPAVGARTYEPAAGAGAYEPAAGAGAYELPAPAPAPTPAPTPTAASSSYDLPAPEREATAGHSLAEATGAAGTAGTAGTTGVVGTAEPAEPAYGRPDRPAAEPPFPSPVATPAPAPAARTNPGPLLAAVPPAAPVPLAESSSDTAGGIPQFGESGLPKRRRGRTLAAAHPEGPDAPARPAAKPADRRAATARFSTFRQAVQGQAQPQNQARGTTDPTATPHPEGNENR
ncbi:sensor histidine kinase [Streptomyces sp. NPDC058657]|uniref:sensor histidine kinase n=1 Tax=unclassified Streptomyces TaxID=2593676 RepID=UPI003653B159